MKELNITTKVKVYHSPEELNEADSELLSLAKASLANSYSPYSNFKVGAALRFEDGTLIGGSNQENASYPLCLCAERVALSAADSVHPGKKIYAIAITIQSEKKGISEPVSPCGACRQSLCEAENKLGHPIRIILYGESGEVYELASAKDLLPLGFNSSFLD